MSARIGNISQQLILSSTHSPTLPISPFLSLSRMEGKKKKARTRVRKWRGWRTEDGSSLSRTARATMDQDHGLQPSLIPWLVQELSLPSWGQSPNPNPSLFSCMDGSWGLLGKRHPKDENQVCCSSIPLLYRGFSWNSKSLVVLANQSLNPKYPRSSKSPKLH